VPDKRRSDMAYWWPTLYASGVPVPRTELITTDVNLMLACFGEDGPEREFAEFLGMLAGAARRISPAGPWFLRTGQGAGKHNWKNCCHLTDLAKLGDHVAALVEWSEVVDFMGLPWDVWAVREMLPVTPVAVLPNYGDMPLVREVRAFVRDGRVLCSHDYWPLDAIRDGLPPGPRGDFLEADRLFALSSTTADEREEAHAVARCVARAFDGDGAWSVDLLPTANGWHVTDMAPAADSFHWPGCPVAKDQGWGA
jgi:hypothetical protein